MNDVAAFLKVILELLKKIPFSVGIGCTVFVSGFSFLIGNLSYHVLHKFGLGLLVTYRFFFFLIFCCSSFIFVFLVFGYVANILKIRQYQRDILKDCDVCFYLLYMNYSRNERFHCSTDNVAVSKLEKAEFIEDYYSSDSYLITRKGRNVLRNRRRNGRIFHNAKQYARRYVEWIDSEISSNIFIRSSASDFMKNTSISNYKSDLIYQFSKKLLEPSSK